MQRRAPGTGSTVSPRQEVDQIEVLSGLFEGKTTGAPISLLIRNLDARSTDYTPAHRPGHATYTYEQKYGHYDYRGGGRASARETACRVAAGGIAKQFLATLGIDVQAAIETQKNAILQAKQEADSIGGCVYFWTSSLPAGLGDPVYEKLTARLAYALMSIPAARGFEIGEGFQAAKMRGSTHNDAIDAQGKPVTNTAGGVLGGISTGHPLKGSVAFKPTSSIGGEGRHDPCVAVRAVPVVEAMLALVLADAVLMQRSAGR